MGFWSNKLTVHLELTIESWNPNELQDTLKSSPAENKVMKRASFVGVSTTTMFYVLCGCVGYAAFGNDAPGNFLTGFGFYDPFWLIDLANVCIAIHLIGAYQVNILIFSPSMYTYIWFDHSMLSNVTTQHDTTFIMYQSHHACIDLVSRSSNIIFTQTGFLPAHFWVCREVVC